MKHRDQIKCEKIKRIIEKISLVSDISTKSRLNKLVELRFIHYYLCRKFTTASLETIGKTCNRGHDTVINGIKKIHLYLETNQLESIDIYLKAYEIVRNYNHDDFDKVFYSEDYIKIKRVFRCRFISAIEKYRSIINKQSAEILELKKTIINLEERFNINEYSDY